MMMEQRKLKMCLLVVLAILLTGILLPITSALAADGTKTTLDISRGSIVIGDGALSGYNSGGDLITSADDDGYIITGGSDQYTILVSGGTHSITFSGAAVDMSATTGATAFSVAVGATVNISLAGVNELSSGTYCAGLQVSNGAAVTISGSGSLSAHGGTYGAGIGGGRGQSGGSITISGGNVTANGGSRSAGIGGGGNINGSNKTGSITGGTGGAGGSGGSITISGGNVNSTGGPWGAGIGGGGGGVGGSSTYGKGGNGGAGGSGGSITISGGDVAATGGERGAGIGGGSGGNGSSSTYDNGGNGGAGGSSGSIMITSGNVIAAGGSWGAGIGGGSGGAGGYSHYYSGGAGGSGGSGVTIMISGGDVTAAGGLWGAGIGGGGGGAGGGSDGGFYDNGGMGGAGGAGGSITISGDHVTATGGERGTGIGGGGGANGGNADFAGNGGAGGAAGFGGSITITEANVTATGIYSGAGIGSGGYGGGGSSKYGSGGARGSGSAAGTIAISHATVDAQGGNYSAGIGGGAAGSGGEITITSGMVDARSSLYGAGIGGGGISGMGGTITINSGRVTAESQAGAGIGAGSGGSGGAITINGGSVTARSQTNADIGSNAGISSCVVTGGSVNASISCVPTTGGETPVNVYFTVARLSGADNVSVSTLSLSQGGAISYGIEDMCTDANGWLYLYLPAYEGSTTTAITAGTTSYTGYYGLIRDTGTFLNPNVIKIDQTPPLTYADPASKEFNYGEAVTFTYEEMAVTGGMFTEGTVSYTYSGTERGTGVIVTGSTTAPVNAGSYSLNATLPGDDYYHDAVVAKSFIINPKSIASFTALDIGDQIYSGVAQTPAVTVRDGGTALVSERDFSVSSDNINVGTATAIISGQNNYVGTLNKTFKIVPKEITLTLSAVPDATMVGSDVALTATVSGGVDLPAGTVTFQYGDTLIAENVPIGEDDGAYSATATWSSVPAGEYNLTATYNAAADDNYTCVSNGLIANFCILKYNQPDFEFADGTDYAIVDGVINKTYGDSVLALQTVGKMSVGDEIFAVLSGSDVVAIDETTGNITLLKSGTAVISALSPSDATYNEATASVTISVGKAAQSGFGFADSALTKTYGDAPFIVAATGGQSTGGVTYAVTTGSDAASVNADSGVVTIHKSGTVVVTATRAEDDRYLASTADLTITVGKAAQSGFGFADSTLAKTFSHTPFTIAATGGQSSGAVTYTVTAGSDVVVVNAGSGAVTMLKAGTAVVTATRAEDDRYLASTADLTITVGKGAQSGFGFADSTLAKTFSHTQFTIAATGGQSSGEMTYTVTAGSDVVAVNAGSGAVTMLKAGTAVISVTRADDDRFLATNAELTITVAKAAQNGFGFADEFVSKAYGDAPFTFAATGGQSSGEVTYAVTSGRGVVSVNTATGRVAIQKAGRAVITATRAEDERYSTATQTITIVVDKADTYVITPPVAADIEVIGKLSDSVLSGGAGSVPGGFSWASPDQIVSTTGMYEVTFTPEDTVNYAPSTSEVNVQIVPVLSHSSTGIIFNLSQATLPTGISSVAIALSTEPTADVKQSIFALVNNNIEPNYSSNALAIYDLKLLDQNGNQITGFTGTITVRIPIPEGLTGDLRVLWYNPEAETMTDMNARPEDGYLVFETTHFSYYTLVHMTELSASSDIVPNPDTGGKTLLIVALMLLGLVLILGFVVVIRMRIKRI